jgi:hypothetical protein
MIRAALAGMVVLALAACASARIAQTSEEVGDTSARWIIVSYRDNLSRSENAKLAIRLAQNYCAPAKAVYDAQDRGVGGAFSQTNTYGQTFTTVLHVISVRYRCQP